MTFVWFLAASVVSGAAILILRNSDEKRARVLGATVSNMRPRLRKLIGVSVWIPALILLWFGQYNAFLCWLGAILIYGWLAAARKPVGASSGPDG